MLVHKQHTLLVKDISVPFVIGYAPFWYKLVMHAAMLVHQQTTRCLLRCLVPRVVSWIYALSKVPLNQFCRKFQVRKGLNDPLLNIRCASHTLIIIYYREQDGGIYSLAYFPTDEGNHFLDIKIRGVSIWYVHFLYSISHFVEVIDFLE